MDRTLITLNTRKRIASSKISEMERIQRQKKDARLRWENGKQCKLAHEVSEAMEEYHSLLKMSIALEADFIRYGLNIPIRRRVGEEGEHYLWQHLEIDHNTEHHIVDIPVYLDKYWEPVGADDYEEYEFRDYLFEGKNYSLIYSENTNRLIEHGNRS